MCFGTPNQGWVSAVYQLQQAATHSHQALLVQDCSQPPPRNAQSPQLLLVVLLMQFRLLQLLSGHCPQSRLHHSARATQLLMRLAYISKACTATSRAAKRLTALPVTQMLYTAKVTSVDFLTALRVVMMPLCGAYIVLCHLTCNQAASQQAMCRMALQLHTQQTCGRHLLITLCTMIKTAALAHAASTQMKPRQLQGCQLLCSLRG